MGNTASLSWPWPMSGVPPALILEKSTNADYVREVISMVCTFMLVNADTFRTLSQFTAKEHGKVNQGMHKSVQYSLVLMVLRSIYGDEHKEKIEKMVPCPSSSSSTRPGQVPTAASDAHEQSIPVLQGARRLSPSIIIMQCRKIMHGVYQGVDGSIKDMWTHLHTMQCSLQDDMRLCILMHVLMLMYDKHGSIDVIPDDATLRELFKNLRAGNDYMYNVLDNAKRFVHDKELPQEVYIPYCTLLSQIVSERRLQIGQMPNLKHGVISDIPLTPDKFVVYLKDHLHMSKHECEVVRSFITFTENDYGRAVCACGISNAVHTEYLYGRFSTKRFKPEHLLSLQETWIKSKTCAMKICTIWYLLQLASSNNYDDIKECTDNVWKALRKDWLQRKTQATNETDAKFCEDFGGALCNAPNPKKAKNANVGTVSAENANVGTVSREAELLVQEIIVTESVSVNGHKNSRIVMHSPLLTRVFYLAFMFMGKQRIQSLVSKEKAKEEGEKQNGKKRKRAEEETMKRINTYDELKGTLDDIVWHMIALACTNGYDEVGVPWTYEGIRLAIEEFAVTRCAWDMWHERYNHNERMPNSDVCTELACPIGLPKGYNFDAFQTAFNLMLAKHIEGSRIPQERIMHQLNIFSRLANVLSMRMHAGDRAKALSCYALRMHIFSRLANVLLMRMHAGDRAKALSCYALGM